MCLFLEAHLRHLCHIFSYHQYEKSEGEGTGTWTLLQEVERGNVEHEWTTPSKAVHHLHNQDSISKAPGPVATASTIQLCPGFREDENFTSWIFKSYIYHDKYNGLLC